MSVRRELRIVDQIKVAKSCPASWRQMTGDDQKRYCAVCKMHVYNIANMTEQEVEDLVFKTEGEVCVRLYRRWDGLVMTKECGKMRSVKTKVALSLSPIFALFGIAMVWPVMGASKSTPEQVIAWTQRELRHLDQVLENEKDPSKIEELQKQRKDAQMRLKRLGERILEKED